MKDGFVKVAVATPKIKVADCFHNAAVITELILRAEKDEVKLLVLPELCLTGYTCGDLFYQETLLHAAESALFAVAEKTRGTGVVTVLGLPLEVNGKIYNTAAVVQNGRILGIIPKRNLPNYAESSEQRYFAEGSADIISFRGIPFGANLMFEAEQIPGFCLGIEICEDMMVAQPPGAGLAAAGCTLIANPSASPESAGKAGFRKKMIEVYSARLHCAYLYADAGDGESTTDCVFSGHNLIAEDGMLLKEGKPFACEYISTETDLAALAAERRRISTWKTGARETYTKVRIGFPGLKERELPQITLTRKVEAFPFVPSDARARRLRCEEITQIQTAGLGKRLEHINCSHSVIGISGGLDSALALLVTAETYRRAGMDTKNIIAVTMPCFGTTDRTYRNACTLVKELGATLKEVRIEKAVLQHFSDIGQDAGTHDITYENAQARERTQVLMDIANMVNGIVIGTGDLSELALGWATYNGDHMSMYGVNADIPKTMVRHLVEYYAEKAGTEELKAVLRDILDTPVSPELLPPKDGETSQKTEELVGPYELHDFFLYYVLRRGFAPQKILRLAKEAFAGQYDNETLQRLLLNFYKRFFAQQFKRSCLPDGPKVGSVGLSPRSDWRMPSDACARLWLEETEQAGK